MIKADITCYCHLHFKFTYPTSKLKTIVTEIPKNSEGNIHDNDFCFVCFDFTPHTSFDDQPLF